MPSDILGVVYIPYDKNEAWKYKLVEELRNCGYNVSKDDL